MKRMLLGLIAITVLGSRMGSAPAGSGGVTLKALSTDPALVTGGDVLVQVAVPAGTRTVKVTAAGRDVSGAFRPGEQPNTFVGLVTGLANGRNVLAAGGSSLEITNYPITGP
ncbi:MAG TPA: DUF6351 family protein, partial [Vicinamibacterales bacterium]|nr:DUF6351 family protein [Vicinamibacterales bacterium]